MVQAAQRSLDALPRPPHPTLEPDFAGFLDWSRRRLAGDPTLEESQGLELARRRRDDLLDLIRSNPRRALELALPAEVRNLLPASVAELVEHSVAGTGDLEVLCALPEPGQALTSPAVQRFAVFGEERYEAFVYGRRLREPTLRNASLHGIALDGLMAVEESPVRFLSAADASARLKTAPDTTCVLGRDHPAATAEVVGLEAFGNVSLACCPQHASAYEAQLAGFGSTLSAAGASLVAASAATEGTKRLLFIRVDFSDLIGESFSSNRTVVLVRELDRFYRENSYGRSGFFEIGDGSAVTPVFRMPRTAAAYGRLNAALLRNDALAAARAAGFNTAAYDYDLTCMGSVPGFGWAGLGFVGGPGSWIRATSSTGVVAHELGHNYGLLHANFWDTNGESVGGAGSSIEYGDKFDTMGAANAGNYHFNARYKRLLGWLKEGEFTVATTNGTYRLHAHDQTNAVNGSRGLQIFANARTNYWLEFRQRFTNNVWLMNGAGLRWTGRGNEESNLLDTTPGSAREKDDAALVLGRTFSDPVAGLHVTPIARGSSVPAWLDIVVQRGSFPGNRPPVLRLTTSATSGTTATTFQLAAEASDVDGDPLAFSWNFGDDTVGPNQARTSHRWTSAGDYAVRCIVSDLRGGTAQATLLIRVDSPSTFVLRGRVTAYGEPAPGVRINAGSGRLAVTDADGTYVLPGLSRGSLSLTATAAGNRFVPANFTNPINLTASRNQLDFVIADDTAAQSITVIPAGSQWRYWDRGTEPSGDWRTAGFDDSAWNQGPAILGYGGDKETTVVSFGDNSARKHITTWFRRNFVIDDPGRISAARIGLLRDDGALVHLNGREIHRLNLPAGTITPQTLASATVAGTDELTYYDLDVAPSLLAAGTNVLAVEIHQASLNSTDIAFDLRLVTDITRQLDPGIRLTRPLPQDIFSAPSRVVMTAAFVAPGNTTLRRVEFLADGRTVAIATTRPLAAIWSDVPAGPHTLHARAHLDNGTFLDSAPVEIQVNDPDLTPTLITRQSVWRYLDTGIAPADTWRDVGFEDRNWPAGQARLGYGEDGEFTTLSFGPDPSQKFITSWFRHTFYLSEAGTVTNLVCRLQRDDGAVVYLNGTEVVRLGLPDGPISPSQLAEGELSSDGEQAWNERSVSPAALREGLNVVAVEMHQSSASSSDLGFDLELAARRARITPPPRIEVRLDVGSIVLQWPASAAPPAWRLESAPSPAPDAPWQTSNAAPTLNGAHFESRFPTSDIPRFFRLRRTTAP